MFRYEYPQFEKKRILRVEMLDQLRDYPKNFLKLSFQEMGDGIVSGCKVTWDEGKLTISPGILNRKGNLYFMEKPYEMDCQAEDKIRYLKVQFLTEVRDVGKITGNTRISIDDQKPDSACEIELCRFRLQKGARLRDCHENLKDYSTEYDTMNLVYSPFSSEGGSTLNPRIVKQFSKEMMRKQSANPYDISFCMVALSNNGLVTVDCIREYLSARLGETYENRENGALYRGLLEVLENQKSGVTKKGTSGQGKRSVMLL